MTRRRVAVVACAIGVTLFALVYLLPSTVGKAFEMDEGAVNAYAARVLDGAVPHRDFLTFYGPGNLWIVAGAFAVAGESVGIERAVGIVYRLLIVLALFVLGKRLGGLVGGIAAAIVAATLLAGDIVWAYATYGALAFGLLGLAILSEATTTASSRRTSVLLAAAGAASGVAILIRFDFLAAVVLSVLPMLALSSKYARVRVAAGFLAILGIFVVHLAIVGPQRVQRVVSDLAATGSGRSLPWQNVWDYPANLLAAANLATAALVGVGAVLVWRRRRDLEPRVALAAGLFSVALIPLTISRMDPLHIMAYSVLPLSLLPGLLLLALSPLLASRRRPAVAVLVSIGVAWGVVHYGDYSLERLESVRGVRGGYRGFYDDDSAGARIAVERVRDLARPGDTLFVGPQDLRRTNYGPTYMYFLLRRELQPASYYMEMNPGTANREGSGLADDIRGADWLILTSEWDDWSEPNDSSDFGPSEPNEVVRGDFCPRLESGQYRLYERCDRAAG